MITTPDLISGLTSNLSPVRRLRPPLIRALQWLALALFVLVLVSLAHGLRPGLSAMFQNPSFVIEITASLLTGICAAIAAFYLSLPDRRPMWALLPLPPLSLWIASIGAQCISHWVAIGPEGMQLGETAECFATLGLTSLPLTLALLLMLRHAAPLHPTNVILLGSLSVAGITATALSLFHALDASLLILLFNIGTALLFLGVGAVINALNNRAAITP